MTEQAGESSDVDRALHVEHVVVDCADPERLAAFWSALLGVGIAGRWNQYVMLRPTRDGAPGLAFQLVGEDKMAKNRVHLDFPVGDLAAATDRAVGLGATLLDRNEQDGVVVQILADPEGNELCLVKLPDDGS